MFWSPVPFRYYLRSHPSLIPWLTERRLIPKVSGSLGMNGNKEQTNKIRILLLYYIDFWGQDSDQEWRRKRQPTPVFLPGESQGQRSLAGCSLWGHKESDTTEALSTKTHSVTFWESRKQPRCPSADKWIKKLRYIYTMEYYSAIKKNAFESILMRWMKLEPITEWSKSERERQVLYINAYLWNLERW